MEADPKHFPRANVKAARALANYLVAERTQQFLLAFGATMPAGIPLCYPIDPRR